MTDYDPDAVRQRREEVTEGLLYLADAARQSLAEAPDVASAARAARALYRITEAHSQLTVATDAGT